MRSSDIDWHLVSELSCAIMVSAKCATWSDGMQAEAVARTRARIKDLAKQFGLEVTDGEQS